MDEVSQIDLAFCIDLTNSMAQFLTLAKAHVTDILAGLGEAAKAKLRVAVVGYRDYGKGQTPLELHPFTKSLKTARASVKKLRVKNPGSTNTDAAEAVFGGLVTCIDELDWRPSAVRALVLIGDAPPHGCGATKGACPDRYADGDPTGETLKS